MLLVLFTCIDCFPPSPQAILCSGWHKIHPMIVMSDHILLLALHVKEKNEEEGVILRTWPDMHIAVISSNEFITLVPKYSLKHEM